MVWNIKYKKNAEILLHYSSIYTSLPPEIAIKVFAKIAFSFFDRSKFVEMHYGEMAGEFFNTFPYTCTSCKNIYVTDASRQI